MSEPELIVLSTETDTARELRADVRDGLRSTPKRLSSKWLYDTRGSELFERITELSEYYQKRAEQRVLRDNAVEIAGLTGVGTLVELGSGSSEKTRLLLDAMRDETLERFVPLDVSESALRSAVEAIALDYPGLTVRGVVGDFTTGLAKMPAADDRMVAFLGGTIGNLLPDQRAEFLASVRAALRPGEWLLLGTDLVKDPDRLVRAYDDAEGVTAEFNRNVLRMLNRELGADFPVEDFEHRVHWDADREWIEMRLRAGRALRVFVRDLDMTVDFAAGEEIRTEISAKFRLDRIRRELDVGGFDLCRWWSDEAGDFAVSLASAR